MASINWRGESARILVSNGYRMKDGKRVKNTETMTWTPPEGMSQKRIYAEVLKVAFEFENKVKNGHYLDGEKITFAEFCERWFSDHAEGKLKPKTIQEYHALLDGRILPAIGHHTLAKLQPAILIKFVKALQEPGLNASIKYKAKPKIRETWKASGKKLAEVGISDQTLTSILNGRNVNQASAEKFSKALKKKVKDLFVPAEKPKDLSANTVNHYFRCISTILSTAVEWQVIEANPCDRVATPTIVQKKIKYLELDQSLALIETAKKLDDLQIQTAILIFLYTGLRLGELAGLQWNDFDLKNGVITAERAIQYIRKMSLIITDTKTDSSERFFSISDDLVDQLRKYRSFCLERQLKAGDRWQAKARKLHEEERQQLEAEGKKPLPKFKPVAWLFTNDKGLPLHPSTIYHWIKPYLVEHGYPDMTIHGLRHTNISLMLAQGVDLVTASHRAGHAKPSTTANIYAHFIKKPDKAAAEKINDIFKSAEQKSGNA